MQNPSKLINSRSLFFKMNQKLLQHVEQKSARANAPEILAGMSVRVSQKIKEGEKERVQNFEGLVISTNGGIGANATFTVRKIFSGIGVEKVFPLHSKNIVKIEVLKKAKVRRSKLYYMRDLRGKAARMNETHIHEIIHDEEADKKAAEMELKAKEEAEQPNEEKVEVEKNEKPAEEPKVEPEKAEKPAEEKVEKEKPKAEEPKKEEV